MDISQIDLRQLLWFMGGAMLVGLVLSLLLVVWVVWRVKKLYIPPGADFMTTLRHTPLSVVILLDMLDLALDFFSAPFAWVLLGYLGLQSLRSVTVVESLIPATNMIPTMTLAWLYARFIDSGRKYYYPVTPDEKEVRPPRLPDRSGDR